MVFRENYFERSTWFDWMDGTGPGSHMYCFYHDLRHFIILIRLVDL